MMNVLIVLLMIIFIFIVFIYKNVKEMKRHHCRKIMFEEYFEIANYWVAIKNSNSSIEKFLIDKDIKSIGIYGGGELGTRLYEDLINTSIKIKYITDSKMKGKDSNMSFNVTPIVNFENYKELNNVDAIIITPFFYEDSIKQDLIKSGFAKEILSLDKIITDIYKKNI